MHKDGLSGMILMKSITTKVTILKIIKPSERAIKKI